MRKAGTSRLIECCDKLPGARRNRTLCDPKEYREDDPASDQLVLLSTDKHPAKGKINSGPACSINNVSERTECPGISTLPITRTSPVSPGISCRRGGHWKETGIQCARSLPVTRVHSSGSGTTIGRSMGRRELRVQRNARTAQQLTWHLAYCLNGDLCAKRRLAR